MGAARGGATGADLAGRLRLRRVDRGQPAEPSVRARRPGRIHPSGGDRVRRAAPRDRTRDHRDRADEGRRQRQHDLAPVERDGRGDLDRRLRHRLLVAGLPDQHADQRVEDRPLVRARARPGAEEFGHRRRHHRAGPLARDAGGGRGRGDAAPDGGVASPGLPPDAGLPVQPASAAGRDGGLARADPARSQGAVDRRPRR